MAGNKYIANSSGALAEVAAIQSSAGAGDAGKIPALDSGGKIDSTMMPVGIAADTKSIVASEALSAGNYVNIYNNAGTPNCRKADASSAGKEAHGYVLAAVSSSASATVYFDDLNNQCSGMTAGNQYLSATTPGVPTGTAPVTAGQVVQRLGVAVSATELHTAIGPAITLA